MKTQLWTWPLLGLTTGILLCVTTLAIDDATGYDLIPASVTGTPVAAQALTSTIITAMVTLISVVLTVMTVAVQLAMGQFSPRIVSALLTDRFHRFAFGLFAATSAFGIVALRGINDQAEHVPGLTVVTLYILAVCTLATLIVYVAHAGARLRASGLIDLVGDQLHVEIERRFPPGAPPAPPPDAIPAPVPGIITGIDADRLIASAARADVVLELQGRMGDFIPAGAPLFIVRGASPDAVGEVTDLVTLHDERTHSDDPAYGFRKLVDIAIRSAADDPSTTVEALHRIHDAMRALAVRPFPEERFADAAGTVRLVWPIHTWADYVRLAFEEIRLAGASQPQITRRLRAALEDLKTVAPPDRRPALDEQLELLQAGVRRGHDDDLDARLALTPDPQGIG